MSDKNLLIGDTTYPHLAQSTNENICAQLRELAPDLVKHHTKQIVFAIDRIEQLERELAEAQKDASRWNYVKQTTTAVRDGSQVLFCTPDEFQDSVDTAINGVKA